VSETLLGATHRELVLVAFLAGLVFLGTKISAIGSFFGRFFDRTP
jgi:hypothetical protein